MAGAVTLRSSQSPCAHCAILDKKRRPKQTGRAHPVPTVRAVITPSSWCSDSWNITVSLWKPRSPLLYSCPKEFLSISVSTFSVLWTLQVTLVQRDYSKTNQPNNKNQNLISYFSNFPHIGHPGTMGALLASCLFCTVVPRF